VKRRVDGGKNPKIKEKRGVVKDRTKGNVLGGQGPNSEHPGLEKLEIMKEV